MKRTLNKHEGIGLFSRKRLATNELRLFNFEEFVSFTKWSKFAYKNGVLGGQIK